MRINMFGALAARHQGSHLGPGDLGGVKPRELFEILLLNRGRPVSKLTLADDLWPDRQPDNIVAALESYVSVLRRHLGGRQVGSQIVKTTTGAYLVDREFVTVDLDLFDELELSATNNARDRVRLRTQALSLVTGDVLEDAGDAGWAMGERQRYRERVARCATLLSRDLLIAGDHANAVERAEQAIRVAPYSEQGYRLAMLANYGMHFDGLAMSVLERCRRAFGGDLGRDLTSETEDLGGDIDAGVPYEQLIAVLAEGERVSVASDRRVGDRRSPARQLPIIGRDEHVHDIERLIRRSTSGSFTVALVEGSSGVGRSALLDQIAVLPTAGPIGRHRYRPEHRERPNVPLAASLVDATQGTAWAADAIEYASLSWLGDDSFIGPLRDLLASIGPVVLLLDDLQWAPPSLVRCLEELCSSEGRLPVTVVATALRPASQRHTDLSRLAVSHTFRLMPIEPTDVPDGVDAEVIQQSGGVPALAADLWRWRLDGRSGLSTSMTRSVLASVRGLDPAETAVLSVASSLAEPFHPAALRNGSLQPAEGFERHCQRLVEMDLFVPCESGGFRFRAPIVRQMISEATSRSRSVSPPSTSAA